MRFLVDTNVLAEPMKPAPNPSVVAAIQAHLHEIAISAPAWHEMWFGCLRIPSPSKRRAAIETYLERGVGGVFPILAYDNGAARWHAIERARLTATGKTPSFVDGQIAAIAATQGLVLVTANGRDFHHFSGLTVVDWSQG